MLIRVGTLCKRYRNKWTLIACFAWVDMLFHPKWSHLAKRPSDLKQNGTQEKTPFSYLLVWLVIAEKSSKNTMVWAYLGGGGKIWEEDRRSSLLLVELDLEDFEARSASPPSGLLVRSNRPPRFPWPPWCSWIFCRSKPFCCWIICRTKPSCSLISRWSWRKTDFSLSRAWRIEFSLCLSSWFLMALSRILDSKTWRRLLSEIHFWKSASLCLYWKCTAVFRTSVDFATSWKTVDTA